CSCGNCALDRLQNPGECLCCKEIEKCVESLGGTAVLNEVEISPECITLHPGFIAYREFMQLVHGFLGGKRIPLPACAYHAIRTELSEENEEFVGFEDNE
ncbi:unnamed protein product, partial [Porites lobata]